MPATEYAKKNAAELGVIPEKLDYIDGMLQKFIDDGYRQGYVARAMRSGKIIYEHCCGTNTKPGGLKIDTIFGVASITKPVIGVLIHILQDRGLIDIEERVCDYITRCKGGGKEEIKIWHLLTHSSGLVDAEIDEYYTNFLKENCGESPLEDKEWHEYYKKLLIKFDIPEEGDWMSTVQEKIFESMPMKRKVRSINSYCGTGFQMLKEIVCKITGESIDAFASRNLFAPLGMDDTYWIVPQEKWDRIVGRNELAHAYPYQNTEHAYKSESGSGGLKTTVPDILRLLEMIRLGGELDGVRVLSKAAVKRLCADHNKSLGEKKEWDAWSLGFNFRADKVDDAGALRSYTSVEHGGWGGTRVIIDPEYDLTAAIFGIDMRVEAPNTSARINNMLIASLL